MESASFETEQQLQRNRHSAEGLMLWDIIATMCRLVSVYSFEYTSSLDSSILIIWSLKMIRTPALLICQYSPAICRNPSEAHRLSQISRWESQIHVELAPPTAGGTPWRGCWIALLKYYCLMIFHTSSNGAIQYWLRMSRPLLVFVFASFLGSSLSSAPAFHLAASPLHFAAPCCPLLHPTFECGKTGLKTN